MHDVSLEESRRHVPVGLRGAIFVYRPHTEFSEFVMDVVEKIHECGIQRAVILVQTGVSEAVVNDATHRIAELLESRGGVTPPVREDQKIAIECFHGLTRVELRRLKRQWQRSRKETE